MNQKELKKEFSFWRWWFIYGIRKLFNLWLILHIILGILGSYFIRIRIEDAALLVVVPLAGLLIGLSFAWVGNAMALLESDEVKKVIEKRERGLKEYIFSYQSSILLIFVSIVSWAIIGFKIHLHPAFAFLPKYIRFILKVYLFFITSVALRECWQIVMATQWLLLMKAKVSSILSNKNKNDSN